MNNLIQTLALTSNLLTGTDSDNQKYVYEADLTIQQLKYKQHEYVEADFSGSDDGKYIHVDDYKKKQKHITKKLKKQRIKEKLELEEIERQRKLAEQQLAEQREIQRQLEIKRQQEEQQRREELQLAQQKQQEKQRQQESQQSQRPQVKEETKVQQQSSDDISQKQPTQTTQPTSQSSGETFQITYYTAFCPEGCTGVTASGHNVSGTTTYNGMKIVAADPRFSLGTKLKVTYNNGTSFVAIVLDRGGAIHGNILDVLVSNEAEARRLGRTTAKVEVLN